MIPWKIVFNRFGFSLSYLKEPDFTFGFSFSFSVGNFYWTIGLNPEQRNKNV